MKIDELLKKGTTIRFPVYQGSAAEQVTEEVFNNAFALCQSGTSLPIEDLGIYLKMESVFEYNDPLKKEIQIVVEGRIVGEDGKP